MKAKLGDILHLTFFDHCMRSGVSGEGAIECEVFGRLIRQDKSTYTVAAWQEKNTLDQNTETFVIMRSTVTSVRRLK